MFQAETEVEGRGIGWLDVIFCDCNPSNTKRFRTPAEFRGVLSSCLSDSILGPEMSFSNGSFLVAGTG